MELNIYGRNPVYEALRSSFTVQEVWVADSAEGRIIQQIRGLAAGKNVPVKIVPKNDLQKLSGPVVHQGVAARISDFTLLTEGRFFELIEQISTPAIVVLDQMQDPHNLGAIIRTAEVAGIDVLVLPQKGSAEVNATVAKTSAGALFHIPLYQCNDLVTLLATFTDMGIETLAAMPGNNRMIHDVDMTTSLALVIGSEGMGVRKNIARLCRQQITIPQSGKVDSLNASVAAGVIMYELVRQRRKAD